MDVVTGRKGASFVLSVVTSIAALIIQSHASLVFAHVVRGRLGYARFNFSPAMKALADFEKVLAPRITFVI